MENDEEVNELLLSKNLNDQNDLQKIEDSIRSSFITKVYLILLFQLSITSIFIFLSLFSPLYIEIVQNSIFLYYFFFNSFINMCFNSNLLPKFISKSSFKLHFINNFYNWFFL